MLSSGDAICIVCKVGHQVASFALPHCFGLSYWHYHLVLTWYLHQPESHQLSFTNISQRRTDTRTHRSDQGHLGPIKRRCTFSKGKSLHFSDFCIKLNYFLSIFWVFLNSANLSRFLLYGKIPELQVHLQIEVAKKTVKIMQRMRSQEKRIRWPLYRDNRLLPRATKLSHFSSVL